MIERPVDQSDAATCWTVGRTSEALCPENLDIEYGGLHGYSRETLQATLSETEYGALSCSPEHRRLIGAEGRVGTWRIAHDSKRGAAHLAEAGFATSEKSGRATLWRLAVTHPSISDWLEKSGHRHAARLGSSPYSTGGGGVRLEHSMRPALLLACSRAKRLPELGDSLAVDSIRLQASDISEVDDILSKDAMPMGTCTERRSPCAGARLLLAVILRPFHCSATS